MADMSKFADIDIDPGILFGGLKIVKDAAVFQVNVGLAF